MVTEEAVTAGALALAKRNNASSHEPFMGISRAVLESALSAAEPVAWMDNGETRNGSTSTSFRVVTAETKAAMPKASADNFNTPLYAAPPAPSVAVKELPYHCDVCSSPGYGDAPCSPLCDRSTLSEQVQDDSEIVDCLLAGKTFVFDPATNFCHADDGGAPEHGIKYIHAAQVQYVAELDADEIASAISTAACELGDIPDPEGDDTISITVRDLEAIAHRHITVAIERAASPAKQE